MAQNRSLPLALEATANVTKPSLPLLPSVHSALVQFLTGGFAGRDVSYFASVPLVSGGFPANSIDQIWFAYNGIDRGNGSLQVGRLPTPIFAPWTSQSLSLSGYGAASLQVGLNSSTIADNRWGASYTQFGHLGLTGNVAYLMGDGSLERAFRTDGEGTSLTASLQYLSPESRWSGGIAGLSGSFPLPSGAGDRYTRLAALAAYAGDRYELIAIGTAGRDANPNGATSPAVGSRALSFETIYGPRPWLHLDLRYEHTDDGLGTSTVNYIFDSAFSLRPNIIVNVEDRASAGKGPVLNYQLLWAGPWYRSRFPPQTMPQAMPMSPTPMPMSASPMPMSASPIPKSATLPLGSDDPGTIANGKAIYFTGTDSKGAQITTSTPARSYQSCAVCHGPAGEGGVLLADGAISAKLGSHAHMLDQMASMSSMKSATKPWTLALFERAISEGLDEEGNPLSPVMPRWKMSQRDLHDIALYISTQIR